MSSPVPSPTRTVVALTLLFLADALAVGQGLVSLLTALAGLALLLAGALWAGLRRRGALARSRALRAALLLASAAKSFCRAKSSRRSTPTWPAAATTSVRPRSWPSATNSFACDCNS